MTTLTTSLIEFWKLSDVNGATSTYNLTNNNTVTFVTGLVDNCANFVKASSQSLSSTNDGGVTSGAFSVSLWVKMITENGSTGDMLWSHGDAGTHIRSFIYYQWNGSGYQLYCAREKLGTGQNANTYVVTLGTTNWHHVVWTYDGSNIKLYVDGVYRATNAASGSGSSGGSDGMAIGKDIIGTAYAWAKIDAVGFWSKALSDGSPSLNGTAGGEVAELYNSGSGIEYPFSSGATTYDGNFHGGGI